MRPVTRRQFLKISGATFGAGVASQFLPLSALGLGSKPAAAQVEVIPTFCEMCFWKCGEFAYVRDGRLWKLEGNPVDPQSRGRLCPRGTGGVGAHTDPNRLQKPLMRKNARGQAEWATATWEQALDETAARLKAIKDKYGPESIALLTHGAGGSFLRQAMQAYGVVNVGLPSFAQCKGPRDVGWELTIGEGLGSPEPIDFAHTDCLVLIGSHLGENMHNSHVQEFADCVGRGVPIIVVDPRYSVAASKPRHWLPIRPGTDLALILAWMNVIVTEGRYNKAFVEEHGEGFEEFAAEIKDATPEWAAQETGIDAHLIRITAREFSSHAPRTIIHPGRRVVWNGDDTQRSRAIALLNMLMGNWGRKGGFYVSTSMKVPPYPAPKPPKPTAKPVFARDIAYPFADMGEGVTTAIREATLTGKPYPIKAWVVYATDLLHALPGTQETLEAIDNLDLLVVIDTMPSNIAAYADVVLPDTTFLERHDDLFVGWGRKGWMSLRQPVVKAPHDQKPPWWIAKELASRLGVGEYFPWKDMEEYLSTRVKAAGHGWDELKRQGTIVAGGAPVYVEDGLELEFATESGKVIFYSHELKEKGFDPVPKYTPPDAAPPGYYRLITGRAPVHTFSRTQSNPFLADLMPESEVWVNAALAKELGLKGGERVKLKNQDGVVSAPVRVKATQQIRPDCVYMVYGFGHNNPLLRGGGQQGASVAELTTRYKVDPLMGGTSIHSNFVTFVKEA